MFDIYFTRDFLAKEVTKSFKLNPSMSYEKSFLNHVTKIATLSFANKHYTIEDFAKDVGISKTRLFYKMKSLTNLSLGSFLKKVRMYYAKDLIEKGENSISEISFLVGIGDSSYFTKCFKQEFGETPKRYSRVI